MPPPPPDLFQLTMKKKWLEVVKACEADPNACNVKLTKSEETALHIAVSSHHEEETEASKKHAEIVKKLVDSIPRQRAAEALIQMKNDNGDTPLHLAAAIGSKLICQCIAEAGRHALISSRNRKGETPLFLAAHHGKLEAFLLLHQLYRGEDEVRPLHDVDSLCRRGDGDTILHSAISGEYFELGFLIIKHYPKLVNSVNHDGFSPLQVLARKPNIFDSSSNFRLFDRFIYRYLLVHELKEHDLEGLTSRINVSPSQNGTYYPENYKTCMNFFHLPRAAFKIIFPRGQDCGTTGGPSCITDEENIPIKEKELKVLTPPNYFTGVLLVKLFFNVILTIFGIGIWRIPKLKSKKQKHKQAVQILTALLAEESSYRYDCKGGTPAALEWSLLPDMTQKEDFPSTTEEDMSRTNFQGKEPEHNSSDQSDNNAGLGITKEEEKKSEAGKKDANKLTPVLLAAKMGITEIVQMILDTFPVAIQDLDENEKNALLLAVENRQTKVYDLLLKMKLPEFVLYQVDDKGNSAMHLAAKFQKHQPWRIPGAALQMQWEIKWYKYVKETMPPHCFIQYNMEGETASEIFRTTHESLVKDGGDWLFKTSESCSLVAALNATVAFATAATIPGGPNQYTGHPVLENQPAFELFSIASIVALCFSVTALVFFLAILTSRCQQHDFRYDLPRRLLLGLSSLFTSIAAILVSFCAGHFFLLEDDLQTAAYPIYTLACFPITFFAFAQLPLYFDLVWSVARKVPLRSYKVYYH